MKTALKVIGFLLFMLFAMVASSATLDFIKHEYGIVSQLYAIIAYCFLCIIVLFIALIMEKENK